MRLTPAHPPQLEVFSNSGQPNLVNVASPTSTILETSKWIAAMPIKQTRGPQVGRCNICGEVGPLTVDHCPPKGWAGPRVREGLPCSGLTIRSRRFCGDKYYCL